MEATLSRTLTVQCSDFKSIIKFNAEDCMEIGDNTYVQLRPSISGLCHMIVENNGEKSVADIRIGGHYSCAHSVGLMELIKLRNKAQIKDLMESDGDTCTLFASEEEQKPRISHKEMKKRRDEPDSIKVTICIEGEMHEVDVLRPVHGRDRLWVLYESANIGAIITFLRAQPFGEKQSQLELPDGVKNVLKRKNGYIAKKRDSDGKVKYTYTKDLEQAALIVGEYSTHSG